MSTDPSPELTFADILPDDRLLTVLSSIGYETPSPIQAETIPLLLKGRDVMGLAQTGTGKTAAFALPVLSAIDTSAKHVQALVLAPTRELALQVAEAFSTYAQKHPGLHVVPVYGGASYGPQLSGLRRGAHVVVGTPGRVIDHLEKGSLDLTQLTHLVLDEADEMLTMGFSEDVERILRDTPSTKQVALFSATMPPKIRRLSQQYLNDPVEVKVKAKTVTASNTRQRWVNVLPHQKLDLLTRLLEVEPTDGTIVFVRTKQSTEELAERLRGRGFAAQAINGDMVQAQRERTIDQLKSGALDILIATDVAARGLDVQRITHVVNYDIPHDSESYVHRIGRTGRAGRSGEAVLFVTPRERRLLGSIERTTKQPLSQMSLPTVKDVNQTRISRFTEQIDAALNDDAVGTFKYLLAEYLHERDVDPVDVAAALAVMGQDGAPFLLDEKDELDTPKSRNDRGGRDRGGRGRDRDRGGRDRDRGRDGEDGRRGRPKRDRNRGDLVPYRIAVGRRNKVTPGMIVGALANEGGLDRADFGHIQIRMDHTIVDLPDGLPKRAKDALRSTQIAGRDIQLRRDKKHRGRG